MACIDVMFRDAWTKTFHGIANKYSSVESLFMHGSFFRWFWGHKETLFGVISTSCITVLATLNNTPKRITDYKEKQNVIYIYLINRSIHLTDRAQLSCVRFVEFTVYLSPKRIFLLFPISSVYRFPFYNLVTAAAAPSLQSQTGHYMSGFLVHVHIFARSYVLRELWEKY